MAAQHNYEWFRRNYGVPARRNAAVKFNGRRGKITATNGPHVMIKFDDEAKSSGGVYHPTWRMEWLETTKQPQTQSTGSCHS